MDWIKSEGHTGVVRLLKCYLYLYVQFLCRHLQADSWKIVSAADDKTLKVGVHKDFVFAFKN